MYLTSNHLCLLCFILFNQSRKIMFSLFWPKIIQILKYTDVHNNQIATYLISVQNQIQKVSPSFGKTSQKKKKRSKILHVFYFSWFNIYHRLCLSTEETRACRGRGWTWSYCAWWKRGRGGLLWSVPPSTYRMKSFPLWLQPPPSPLRSPPRRLCGPPWTGRVLLHRSCQTNQPSQSRTRPSCPVWKEARSARSLPQAWTLAGERGLQSGRPCFPSWSNRPASPVWAPSPAGTKHTPIIKSLFS